jgi:hypothetical protein
MSLAKAIRRDIAAAKKLRLSGWTVLSLVVCSLPVIWLFDRFWQLNAFLPTAVSAGVIAFVISLNRDCARRVWFWVTITIVAALHVLLIVFVPWTDERISNKAIAGAASLDLVAVIAVVAVVEKLVGIAKADSLR